MKKMLVVLFICLLNNNRLVAQATCDSISKDAFNVLIKNLAGKVANHANLPDSDAATLVKLYNSFTTNLNIRQEDSINGARRLGNIVREFNGYYYDIFKDRYGLVYAKGGTLYLNKLDLWIGPNMTWRCKDFFRVYSK